VAGEEIRLVLPAQSRYVDVAVATMEALADRSGIDAEGVAAIRAQLDTPDGAFRIERELEGGGMSRVFVAIDRKLVTRKIKTYPDNQERRASDV
jgi:hypothetical protein